MSRNKVFDFANFHSRTFRVKLLKYLLRVTSGIASLDYIHLRHLLCDAQMNLCTTLASRDLLYSLYYLTDAQQVASVKYRQLFGDTHKNFHDNALLELKFRRSYAMQFDTPTNFAEREKNIHVRQLCELLNEFITTQYTENLDSIHRNAMEYIVGLIEGDFFDGFNTRSIQRILDWIQIPVLQKLQESIGKTENVRPALCAIVESLRNYNYGMNHWITLELAKQFQCKKVRTGKYITARDILDNLQIEWVKNYPVKFSIAEFMELISTPSKNENLIWSAYKRLPISDAYENMDTIYKLCRANGYGSIVFNVSHFPENSVSFIKRNPTAPCDWNIFNWIRPMNLIDVIRFAPKIVDPSLHEQIIDRNNHSSYDCTNELMEAFPHVDWSVSLHAMTVRDYFYYFIPRYGNVSLHYYNIQSGSNAPFDEERFNVLRMPKSISEYFSKLDAESTNSLPFHHLARIIGGYAEWYCCKAYRRKLATTVTRCIEEELIAECYQRM